MTALDDLIEYLPSTLVSRLGDDQLQQILTVEITDQATRLRPQYRMDDPTVDWDEHLPPLREAICRRCVRTIALRRLPLGISESEVSSLRVGGRDAEISRLEGPYRRVVLG